MEVRVKIKKSAYAPHYAEAKYNGCKGVIIQSSKIHNSYVIKIDKKYNITENPWIDVKHLKLLKGGN